MADVLTIEHDGYGPAVITLDLNDVTNIVTQSYLIAAPEPDIIYHVPDEGETRIVRLEDGDRVATLVMTVNKGTGGDRDTLDSRINEVRATLKAATRNGLDAAFQPYRFKTQPDGATNATYHDIKAGWLDDGQSQFEIAGKKNVMAYHTVLTMILTPYGYRNAITLENFLVSSPHFLEDSNADGLADGWNEVTAAATTTSLVETPALIGHQCQRVDVTSAASAQGIQSDTITCGAASFVNAFAWVAPITGADPIKVQIIDGGGVVAATKTILVGDSGGVADYSVVDRVSNTTWYRVSLAGVTTNANVALRIIRDIADASAGAAWYTDGCYLNVGLVSAPSDGWISSRATENVNSLDTEADINYVDVWGIPGDADAVAFWKPEAQGIGIGFYMGRMTDGKTRASQQIHWLDSADGTGTTSGNGVWSTAASASYAGGSAARFTEGATNNGGYFEWTLSGDAAREFARTPRSVVLVGAVQTAGAVDATFLLGVYGDGTNFASHNVTTSFTLHHVAPGTALLLLGTIDLQGVLPDDVPDTAEPDIIIRVTVDGLANGEIANIDALFMPPVVDDYMVYHITDGSAWAANELWINGHTKQVVPEARGFDRHDWQGSMWTLAPGQTMNRVVLMSFYTVDFTVNYGSGFNWKLDVTPRGRHLIGSR